MWTRIFPYLLITYWRKGNPSFYGIIPYSPVAEFLTWHGVEKVRINYVKSFLIRIYPQVEGICLFLQVQLTLPSLIPTFSLPDVLCDPTNVILKQGTPFEAMTGCTAFIDCVLAEIFRSFTQLYDKWQEICTQPQVSFYYHTYY